jgi:hypothetical protein
MESKSKVGSANRYNFERCKGNKLLITKTFCMK